MRRQLIPALRMVAVLTVLCGLLYPLAMTGVAQALFADKADGSLIERDGEVVGSSLVGQVFTAPEYFHTRPSAACGSTR
ncbi:potassium-transporting ATPase subunit C, partial [Pseudomonas sp. T2.1D-1.1]|uniref:potassium-transporting ATPase subunit C n=1 Tax=Pseudomonas sp. T2.1D-1.1 TaxID=3041168 RepID=UPI00254001AD